MAEGQLLSFIIQYWKIVENSGISHIKWQLKTLSGLYALTLHMHIATGVHIAGEISKTIDNDIEFSAICKNNHKSKYCNLTDPRDAFCIFRFLSGIRGAVKNVLADFVR